MLLLGKPNVKTADSAITIIIVTVIKQKVTNQNFIYLQIPKLLYLYAPRFNPQFISVHVPSF